MVLINIIEKKNMNYIQGHKRREYTIFPNQIDDYVGKDDPVRLMDKFTNVQRYNNTNPTKFVNRR